MEIQGCPWDMPKMVDAPYLLFTEDHSTEKHESHPTATCLELHQFHSCWLNPNKQNHWDDVSCSWYVLLTFHLLETHQTSSNIPGWWCEPLWKNIRQLRWSFPIYGKIKHVPNHQPENNGVSQCIFPSPFPPRWPVALHPKRRSHPGSTGPDRRGGGSPSRI